jgi:hypothetical protein
MGPDTSASGCRGRLGVIPCGSGGECEGRAEGDGGEESGCFLHGDPVVARPSARCNNYFEVARL